MPTVWKILVTVPHNNNIVWILGGDRPPQDDKDDWKPVHAATAKGLTRRQAFLKPFTGRLCMGKFVYLHNQS